MMASSSNKIVLFGLGMDAVALPDVVKQCATAITTKQHMLIGVVNAAKVVKVQHDLLLRESLLACDILLADGQSVVWASRILRKPLPERVAGIDLFQELLRLADHEKRSIYLLGAKADVLATLRHRIADSFPGLCIAGSHDGYFTDDDAEMVAQDIRASSADMLFLGMTTPKKEIFLSRFGKVLDVPVLHGVGGSFDVLAGITRRAPQSWQRLGLEWLYRLLQEPRRLWRRYLTTNSAFVALTVREVLRPTPAYETQQILEAPERQSFIEGNIR